MQYALRFSLNAAIVLISAYCVALVGAYSADASHYVSSVLTVLLLSIAALGTLISGLALGHVWHSYLQYMIRDRQFSRPGITSWACAFIAICWMYGLLGNPVHSHGLNPWYWFDDPNDWSALVPIFGALPLTVSILAHKLPNIDDRALLSKLI